MPETTQAGPCGELHEKLSACVSANGEGGCEEVNAQLQQCLADNSA